MSPEPKENGPDFYSGYEGWKQWTKPFSFSQEEDRYFAGELRNVILNGAEVLEIGFGSGSFLAWAVARGARVSGTEINPAMLEAASKEGIGLLPADFEEVSDTHRDRFDIIVAFDVFEHFELEKVAIRLKACEQMLKIGGQVILRFPNGQSPFGLPSQMGDATHRCALSRTIIEQLLGDSSLQVRRYGPAFRAYGGNPLTALLRGLRYSIRSMISAAFNLIYNQAIPWDAVVTIVLIKKPR